jgi:hypothetical protein
MRPNYYQLSLDVLKELHEEFPDVRLSRHITTASDDIESLNDKDFYKALVKYQNELAIDGSNQPFDEFVSKIVEDGKHLFDEEEEDGY